MPRNRSSTKAKVGPNVSVNVAQNGAEDATLGNHYSTLEAFKQ